MFYPSSCVDSWLRPWQQSTICLQARPKVSSTVPAIDATPILAAAADILRLDADALERPDIPQ
jgi:hypothetical protein